MPTSHHSGFKAINEPRNPQDQHNGLSSRLQEGARQLAPKPAQLVTQEVAESAEGVVTRRQAAAGTQRPATPLQQHIPQTQQAVSGAEVGEGHRQIKTGKSFREVVGV